MDARVQQRRTFNSLYDDYLSTAIQAFLTDRYVQGMSPKTVKFYREKLGSFARFADSQQITRITQVDKNSIRLFLLHLEERGHNPGGRHAHYRALKAFLRWWDAETEPVDWKNPIMGIKAPRVDIPPLKAVPEDVIKAMVESCQGRGFTDLRDRALIMALYDTGARAGELLGMDLQEVDLITGGIMLKKTKNRNPRMVYLSKTSRRELKKYLRARTDDSPALWVSIRGNRLSVDSLRGLLIARARRAHTQYYSPHAYRRGWALSMLRNGTDIFTLQKLGGWRSLVVMRRYLDLDDSDTRAAHVLGSPVERLKTNRTY